MLGNDFFFFFFANLRAFVNTLFGGGEDYLGIELFDSVWDIKFNRELSGSSKLSR